LNNSKQEVGSMRKLILMGSAVLLIAAGYLGAQEQKPKLALTVTLQKEVKIKKDSAWVTQMTPADRTVKNDVLLVDIAYQNQGKSEARNASILDPIPNGTVYIMGSAEGKDANIAFSVDGGKTFQPAPVKYLVKSKDGSLEEKAAPAEMHTHIQWVLKTPVQPGQSGTVSFKVKVK